MDKQFVAAQVQSILASDAQETSAALSSPASSPSEVSGRFSSISYNKGASIIRMLQHVIGYENFKKGLQNYLSEKLVLTLNIRLCCIIEFFFKTASSKIQNLKIYGILFKNLLPKVYCQNQIH